MLNKKQSRNKVSKKEKFQTVMHISLSLSYTHTIHDQKKNLNKRRQLVAQSYMVILTRANCWPSTSYKTSKHKKMYAQYQPVVVGLGIVKTKN